MVHHSPLSYDFPVSISLIHMGNIQFYAFGPVGLANQPLSVLLGRNFDVARYVQTFQSNSFIRGMLTGTMTYTILYQFQCP